MPSASTKGEKWDVFRGQMTDTVKSKLASLCIELVRVPANMTHFFQPLDFTVNGSAKNLAILFCFGSTTACSVIKPLHFTANGRATILRGWKKAGLLLDGTTVLPPEDPFDEFYD